MAVKSLFALFVLFSFTSSCEAKSENCSEARCKLVPVGGVFRERCAIDLLELKIGNNSYHPLEIKDKFLAERWVWANTINEPMLSLSYDDDILSLGLLTYQVVGRALLNETVYRSGELLHETDVVCVAIIQEATDSYSEFFEGNVKYHCCGKSKGESAEGSSIHCERIVNSSGWFKAFNGILNILTVVMVFYCPAFLLAVPDFIFNFQEECKKEEQRDKRHHPKSITNRQGSRYGSKGETTPPLSGNESVQTDQLSIRVLSDRV
ncbi:hypothetical protein OS493_019981 [Desmophyllum pertusum]|uniref:Uncharacterized protein n=1 Tax=Desmophyllum pertusum TaxID=174260 RepID=A0A9W9YBB9_9CNID|nr:hypothetical protein OS493_019981 [Desmophyllum pertusum]